MGFLSTSIRKVRTVVIFDIGSGSVGGAISHIPDDVASIPTISKTFRTDITVRTELDFNIFLEDMLKALHTVADDLIKSGIGPIDEIVCVLASPWYLSETRVIKMARPSAFLFTKRIADELLQKEVTLLIDSYQKKYGTSEGSPEVMEHHVVGVSLNGYPVDDPLGKRTKSIEMNMIVSLSPKMCLDKIRDTLAESFHHTPVSFSSFVVASYLAVRDKYISPDSYMLIDIAGEITDVAIVSKGVLKAALSFPYGRNSILKQLCNSRDIPMRDAKELFLLWSSNTLEKKRKEKVDPLFKSIEEKWSASLRQCIGSLPQTLSLPSTVFLTAEMDIQGWFKEVIANEGYSASLHGDQTCTVVTLSGPDFLTMCNFKEGICDPFLMIEAIAVMRQKVPVTVS